MDHNIDIYRQIEANKVPKVNLNAVQLPIRYIAIEIGEIETSIRCTSKENY